MFGLQCFIIFIIVYVAVKLAMRPVLRSTSLSYLENATTYIMELKDMGIFHTDEIERVQKLLDAQITKRKCHYDQYVDLLCELRDNAYYSEHQYREKLKALDNYFN